MKKIHCMNHKLVRKDVFKDYSSGYNYQLFKKKGNFLSEMCMKGFIVVRQVQTKDLSAHYVSYWSIDDRPPTPPMCIYTS